MVLFETERLSVRRFTAGDTEDFFLLNGDARAMFFIRPAKDRMQSDTFLMENIRFYLDSSPMGRFAVHEKESGVFVGTFSFLYLRGEADFHIGYALLPGAWGYGFATELVQHGIKYFFNNTRHRSLFAMTDPANHASQRVLLKCGFIREGTITEQEKQLDMFRTDNSTVDIQRQ